MRLRFFQRAKRYVNNSLHDDPDFVPLFIMIIKDFLSKGFAYELIQIDTLNMPLNKSSLLCSCCVSVSWKQRKGLARGFCFKFWGILLCFYWTWKVALTTTLQFGTSNSQQCVPNYIQGQFENINCHHVAWSTLQIQKHFVILPHP